MRGFPSGWAASWGLGPLKYFNVAGTAVGDIDAVRVSRWDPLGSGAMAQATNGLTYSGRKALANPGRSGGSGARSGGPYEWQKWRSG